MTHAWADGLNGRIRRAARLARGDRTAQEIADEVTRLGYPMTRALLANFETGRKKSLDVAELIILAAALRVPPVTLLFPDLPDGEVEVLPGHRRPTQEALWWFTGEIDAVEPRSDLGTLLKLTRDREAKERERADADRVARFLVDRADGNDEQAKKALDAILEVIDVADEIRALDAEIEVIRASIKTNTKDDAK